MKKAGICLLSGCALFLCLTVLPLGTVLSSRLGYTFELTSASLSAILTAALAVGSVAACVSTVNRSTSARYVLLLPLSVINAAFYLFEFGGMEIAVCMSVCIGCCCYLTFKYGKPTVLKAIVLVLSVGMLLPLGFLFLTVQIFGDLGQNTVVRSVESPCGTYYADVIDSDQGTLGGNTFVDVYENTGIHTFAFRISKKPKRIYCGGWGEWERMEIYWKDDSCLVINTIAYQTEE